MKEDYRIILGRKCDELGITNPRVAIELALILEQELATRDAEIVAAIEQEIEKWQPTYDDLSAAHIDGLKSAITFIKNKLV